MVAGTLSGQSIDDSDQSMLQADNLLDKARFAGLDSEKAALAEEALAISRSSRYESGLIRASLMLGEICARTNKTEEALQHYLEAESKLRPMGNKSSLTAVYGALGDLFFREKLYGTARRYYSESLNLQPQDYAIMEKAADAYLFEMRFDSAESYYKRLIVKYKNDESNPRLVQIYQKLATAYDQNSNAGKSLYYYLAIEKIIEVSGTPREKSLLYNNMGRQYASTNDYKKALEYFKRAELQCAYIPCDYPEVLFANMGIALHNTGNTKEGIEYLLKARRILLDHKDFIALANLEHLTAGVYFSSNDLYNALAHNDVAIKYARQTKQRDVLANAYRTAADLHHELYDFEKAYEFYQAYLITMDSVRYDEQSKQQRINQQRTLLTSAEGQIKFLIAQQNIKDLALEQERAEKETLLLRNEKLALETRRKEDEVLLLQKQKEVDLVKLREQTLQALQARQELRLAAQQLDIAEFKRAEEIMQARQLADSTQQAQELEILRRDKDISDLKITQQDTFRKFVYGIGGLGIVILSLLGIGFLFARRSNARLNKQNRKIQAQNKVIIEERHKSDQLLRNILPEEIADELKSRGNATPRYYPTATVLFTDFVNFTSLSAQLSPEALIDELNECFLAFDEISERHGLEKIKTIGDAFMCAGGLPIPNTTHAADAVRAGLEMMDWLNQRNAENPDAKFRQMRLGIHTGPVVAGVIGKNKFAYDIWGDAVNLAARMEENGEPGRINISQSTADAVLGQFKIMHRGKKDVHNKGMVDMYFAEPVQP